MTTFDSNPGFTQFIAWKLGKFASSRSEAKTKVRTRERTQFQAIVRFVLQVAGLSCLTYAGFEWSTIAGWVVAGISFFVLSTLLTTSDASPPPTVDPMLARR